jgi:hypothetical protein
MRSWPSSSGGSGGGRRSSARITTTQNVSPRQAVEGLNMALPRRQRATIGTTRGVLPARRLAPSGHLLQTSVARVLASNIDCGMTSIDLGQ